jgi:glycerol kinase
MQKALQKPADLMQAYKLGPDEPAQYALEGAIAIAGAGVSWLKDSLRIIDSPEESATLAASVDSTGGPPLHAPFVLMSVSQEVECRSQRGSQST